MLSAAVTDARAQSECGRVDETPWILSLREGRDSAWRSAVALNPRFWLRRRLARWLFRTTSTGIAYVIVRSTTSGWLRARFHRLVRIK